jgi:AcrR family transcriptional regulator
MTTDAPVLQAVAWRPVDVPQPTPLPVLGRQPRADALRNRRKVLDAAESLFSCRGVGNVSMDDIAEAAGVGKGTLYRGFGDRAGLAYALLDRSGVDFQEGFLRGPPPLGPGAPPRERLIAFFAGLAAHLDEHLELVADAEAGAAGARYRQGPYVAYHAHAAMLLGELDPRLDAQCLAHVLLAPFGAELLLHMRAGLGFDRKRINGATTAIVDGLAAGAGQ